MLNPYERALSGNEQLPFIKTFVREFIQCRPFFVFYTESVMLCPRFIPESVFYTQSVMLSQRFIPSPCFIPSPYSVVRSPQSMFYTDRGYSGY